MVHLDRWSSRLNLVPPFRFSKGLRAGLQAPAVRIDADSERGLERRRSPSVRAKDDDERRDGVVEERLRAMAGG
jgi:hypothetical protein